MDKINVLIIDDEISAIKTLRGMLQQYFPQIKVLDVAQMVGDAYTKAMKHQPDMVFLDIEMPPLGSGFDFLKKCGSYNFGVIFTTAYPKYAIQAINDIQPWAYLVKPYSINELEKALQTAGEKLALKKETAQGQLNNTNLVITDARKGNIVISAASLIFCKADGSTTDLIYKKNGGTETLTASRILKEFEDELPDTVFCRCHHSYLVNLNFVERFEQTGRNGKVHLNNGITIPVSVSKMDFFQKGFMLF